MIYDFIYGIGVAVIRVKKTSIHVKTSIFKDPCTFE